MPTSESVTTLIAITAAVLVGFALFSVLKWLEQGRRDYFRTVELMRQGEELDIELTDGTGKTFVVPLRPTDEESIRSFLRQVEKAQREPTAAG